MCDDSITLNNRDQLESRGFGGKEKGKKKESSSIGVFFSFSFFSLFFFFSFFSLFAFFLFFFFPFFTFFPFSFFRIENTARNRPIRLCYRPTFSTVQKRGVDRRNATRHGVTPTFLCFVCLFVCCCFFFLFFSFLVCEILAI